MNSTQKLIDALNLWLELSEVDPGQATIRISLSGGLDDWTIRGMHDTIKEALELDPSNTTGVLMLEALSHLYFKNRSFSVEELLNDPARAAAYVQKAATFRELVRAPEFLEQNASFVSHLRSALRMYAMDSEPTLALTADLQEMAYLRRDAFRSIEKMRVDQFLSGLPEPEGTKPVYNAWVHQFWSVNELVEAACRQPAGVTLSLVRDPDDLQSYFVFAVRNGGNLFLLSDVPEHVHPLQKYMSRKPEREFSRRTSRNWFPYDLLNLVFDEESRQFFADQARRRSLVPQQQTVDRLKPIADLDPHEVLWIVMMFELILDKFWRKGYQAPALSYTGAMIRQETPLIEAAKSANLPVPIYQTLALPALTREDMTQEKVAAATGGDGGTPNAWLEARYAGQVNPELFNIVDGTGATLYLPPLKGSSHRANSHKNHELALVSDSHVSVLPRDDAQLCSWDKEGRYGLHAMPATRFGTREELEKDRVFLARYNQAKAIKRLADEEFARRKDEVVQWWSDRVRANDDYLLSLAAAGTVWRVFEPTEPGGCLNPGDSYYYTDGTFHFVRTYGPDDESSPPQHTLTLHQGYISRRDKFACVLTGAESSYRVLFQPQNAKQLAELAGCDVADMPDVLQHWSPERDHKGNHLLNRIDPMAWALHDPWCQVKFRVVMHLSKRGMAQVKKRFPDSVAAGEAEALAHQTVKGTVITTIRY